MNENQHYEYKNGKWVLITEDYLCTIEDDGEDDPVEFEVQSD